MKIYVFGDQCFTNKVVFINWYFLKEHSLFFKVEAKQLEIKITSESKDVKKDLGII